MPTPHWLDAYRARGFKLIFFPSKSKGPRTPGWPTRVYTDDDYGEETDGKLGTNVGVLLGTEVEPGKYLADIDYDWPDGLALAKHLLPNTGFAFGRQSRAITHALYTTPAPVASKRYEDPTGRPFVELRGTKIDGSIGLQTMLPPSIHPNGELLTLKGDEAITQAPDLEKQVRHYAIACLLLQQLGHRGLVHSARLAVAGFLLGAGVEEDDVRAIGEAVADATGNSVQDVRDTVRTTAARLRQNEKVQGRGALIKILGDDGKKITSRIIEWLGGSQFIVDEKDRIIANSQENIRRALTRLQITLSFDEFNQKPMIKYNGYAGPLQDTIRNRAWLELDETFHLRPSGEFFDIVVTDLAFKNKYHPVRDYLSLLTWDGVPRLDAWLVTCAQAADNEYVRAVSRLVLLAAVRRVTCPGTKFDEMLVLESSQGLQKSSALAALCPDDTWFSDDLPLDVDAKQIIERTAGKWIIEASDMSGMRAHQVEHLKAMLSRRVDGPVRLAYARMPVEVPRQFIIIGTTNEHTYLSDATGNRRFWPVRVEVFDIGWIKANRDQLWAEAAHLEREGASTRLDPALYPIATLQQDRRHREDPWEELISTHLEPTEEHRLAKDEVWEWVNVLPGHRDERGQQRLNKIMQRLGFTTRTVRNREKKVVRGWHRKMLQLPAQPGLPHAGLTINGSGRGPNDPEHPGWDVGHEPAIEDL